MLANQASSTPPTTAASSDQMMQDGAGMRWTSLGQNRGLQMAWRRLPVFRSDMERRSAVVSLIVRPRCAFHQVSGDMRLPCFKVTVFVQKETNMASKAIGRTGPGKPATIEERAGFLHSTRERTRFICNAWDSLDMN